jgi:hypothetical protein
MDKLARLKELLGSALTQVRQKLVVIRKFTNNLQTIGQIDQHVKLVCNILIEIQEVQRAYLTYQLPTTISKHLLQLIATNSATTTTSNTSTRSSSLPSSSSLLLLLILSNNITINTVASCIAPTSISRLIEHGVVCVVVCVYSSLQLLRDFPAFDNELPSELKSLTNVADQLVQFKRSVLVMVQNILSRLLAVEEFVRTSESLEQVTTVAVTVRDITKVYDR